MASGQWSVVRAACGGGDGLPRRQSRLAMTGLGADVKTAGGASPAPTCTLNLLNDLIHQLNQSTEAYHNVDGTAEPLRLQLWGQLQAQCLARHNPDHTGQGRGN